MPGVVRGVVVKMCAQTTVIASWVGQILLLLEHLAFVIPVSRNPAE
jgi:hypothetical protein